MNNEGELMIHEEQPKMCPLLAIAKPGEIGRTSPNEINCQKDECAWWDGKLEVCVVVHLLNLEYIERSVRRE